MKRRHLFEFEDFSWFPNFFREMVTDFLAFQHEKLCIFEPIAEKMTDVMKKVNVKEVVDLCSGSGGPLALIAPVLRTAVSPDISFTLTDKFPGSHAQNFEMRNAYENMGIKYHAQAVDAKKVPSHFNGLRTLFTCAHHFKPHDLQHMIADSVQNYKPIAIFEPTQRTLVDLIAMLVISPIYLLIASPFVKPFSISRMIFTYLIPIFPLVTTWDGFASCWRSYTPDELREIAKNADPDGKFDWEHGMLLGKKMGVRITYLTGLPKAQAKSVAA